MFKGKLFTVTSIAFSGYFAGLATERYFWSPKTTPAKSDAQSDATNYFPTHLNGLECKPALPIFGTVSAAALLPAKPTEVKNVPPEPAMNTSRVSQVFGLCLHSNICQTHYCVTNTICFYVSCRL